MPFCSDSITSLLKAWQGGEDAARSRLFELVYDELREIARRRRFVGRAGDSLQPTALAHEAYLQLTDRFALPSPQEVESRGEFFLAVGSAMRQILREHWRARQTLKRGGGRGHFPIADDDLAIDPDDFLALDDVLDGLRDYDERLFLVVMHRHFAGRSVTETAAFLKVSETTVKKDWQHACAWLRRAMTE